MLDLRLVVSNLDEVKRRLARRGGGIDLEPLTKLAAERRALTMEVEALRQKQNAANDQVKQKAKDPEAMAALRGEMKELSGRIKALDGKLGEVEAALETELLAIPNLPSDSVPDGKDASQNVVVRTVGEPRRYDFAPKEHSDLGEALGILDFERAAKISGARFTVYYGAGAKLERALINFMLDLHGSRGYREVLPPFMVNRASNLGTGQFPKFEQDVFAIKGHDLFLIPTAEVPVTNLHRDEILDAGQLPLKYVAYTPCFRSEAGSYGKDTRGLIRQHQFQKVELVKFSRPESSYEEHEKLTADAEEVLKRLGLPYRVVLLCAGDMGANAAKCYDLEVWLPGQNAYREISSCSNFEDFQARRAKIRFKEGQGSKPRLVHTLNGSGLAVGRTVVAILENYQRADGSVDVPEALWPYLGGLKRIEKGA
ncbi:MAG TPA: serine--tRNA ligase [Myxococcales bacterium]|nr:serine--tRNA ligase [Myxococcales bacterium]